MPYSIAALACISFWCACLAAPARAEPTWVSPAPGETMPARVVILDAEDGGQLALGRITLADGGIHPGIVSEGICVTPFRGGEARSATFDLATNARAGWVTPAQWDQATPTGRQKTISLYSCRVPLMAGEKRLGWLYGKAYREGVHAQRAYVVFNGREIELLSGFELLRLLPAG
jgi:hypothetical protein